MKPYHKLLLLYVFRNISPYLSPWNYFVLTNQGANRILDEKIEIYIIYGIYLY